jgi:hypothetical protein
MSNESGGGGELEHGGRIARRPLKGQMAMFILTKFAMLFFIMALFTIILIFEQNTRNLSCSQQTQIVANRIANRIAQVIDSPAEDEQRSFVFENSIVLGKNDEAKYTVNITYREHLSKAQKILIDVVPRGVDKCNTMAVVDFTNKTVTLASRPGQIITSINHANYKDEVMQLNPSAPTQNERSTYLTIIKCGSKRYPPSQYLFLEDCVQKNPINCLNFDTPGSGVMEKCGFGDP